MAPHVASILGAEPLLGQVSRVLVPLCTAEEHSSAHLGSAQLLSSGVHHTSQPQTSIGQVLISFLLGGETKRICDFCTSFRVTKEVHKMHSCAICRVYKSTGTLQ